MTTLTAVPRPNDMMIAADTTATGTTTAHPATRSTGRLPRRAYQAGSIGSLFIGALHTFVHQTELAGPELQSRFAQMGDIAVSGGMTPSWDLFQALSLLMGFFAMTIGAVNLGALRASGRPPLEICVANIAMLIGVIAIGYAYLGPMQVYGGYFGITMFAIPPIAACRAALTDRRAR